MSFILDALKKLDKKHKRGSIPNLMTVHEPMPQKLKSRPFWHYLLLVVLLLNAAVFTLWLRPWESKKQNVLKTQPNVKQRLELPAIESEKENPEVQLPVLVSPQDIAKASNSEVKITERPLLRPDKTVSAPDENSVKDLPLYLPEKAEFDRKKNITGAPLPVIDTTEPSEVSPPATEQAPEINHLPGELYTSTENGVETKQKILSLNDLPISVKQNLPEISITAHIYSNNPVSRLVNINGQIIREGETVTDGLKLEEITSVGAIFSYRDYRFQIRKF